MDKPKHDSIPFVITCEDMIVGTINCISNTYLINGNEYHGSYGTDGCVHPNHRRKGLHSILVSSRVKAQEQAGVDFGYIVTDNPIVVKSRSRKMIHPHTFPFNVSYLTRIDNIDQHIREMGSKQKYLWRLKHHVNRALSLPLKSPELNWNLW